MRRILLLATAAALAGCTTLKPDYARPEGAVPASWPVGDAYLRTSEASLASLTYRDVFRDARLQQLIGQAIANNRDLRRSIANIRVARAQYRIERSARLPDIGAGANASFGYGTRGGSGGSSVVPGAGTGTGGTGTGTGGTGTGGTAVTNGGRSDTYSSYSANVGFNSFEIDLFGRVASLSEAALNEYLATEAAARATRLALVGELATAWATYAADTELLAIARDTQASAQQSVRLTRARLEGGIAPRTDLSQAETVLATAQSDLASATTAVAQDRNAIELLAGGPVADASLPGPISGLGAALGEVPAGLDSSILLRRPDVVEAEYRLIAANARIGAARAELFPRISLTGLVGIASTALTGLFSGDNFNAALSPGISLPIFDGGARRAGVDLSLADRDALLAGYGYTLQTAFREVADQLARRGTIAAQVAADERLVAAAADVYRLSDARYKGGIDTFLTSLDAQRALYGARQRLVATRLQNAANLAQLYVALGGDPEIGQAAIDPGR